MLERTQLAGKNMPLRHPVIVTGADRALAVETWLLSAAPDLKTARWEWRQGGPTFLRCGGTFTAIRIPGSVVHAAAGTAEPRAVDGYLEEALDGGPVIAGHGLTRYYALVPASTGPRPDLVPGADCLAPRTLLGVPPVRRTTYQGGESYWSVPMDSPGELCLAAAVDGLAHEGLRCLGEGEDW
ncbi:hypothetical protein AB0L35_38305 [Streptomyces sp. NPDC052309]|uniref:hypothetical protein n=1 Tax=Streptomyces sp. NPDC052309 TaxID=3155421 RepID=UPI003413AA32